MGVLLPLLAAVAVAVGGGPARRVHRVAALLPLALLLPLVFGDAAALPWLLGLTLGLDHTSRALALLTAVGWSLAGWAATTKHGADDRAFWLGWWLSLAGMSLALLALTLTAFYAGYVLVTFSAYLLVLRGGGEEAWRAGRVYLVMALVGEGAILAAVLMVAGVAGNVSLPAAPGEVGGAAAVLLLAGFAVKLGIVPLHVWLPLAHPIAPVPASAVLSGVIVKAGLLGWLKLVPSGSLEPSAPAVLLLLGLLTAFVGAALGLPQRRLKTVLAYSTVSQMGLVLTAYALVHARPEAPAAAMATVVLVALHHGLNKAALFLACAYAPGASTWRRVLVALPALSLAALPLTTGFLAKTALASGVRIGVEAELVPGFAYAAVSLTSAATALLMWRVWRLSALEREGGPLHLAWPLTVGAAIVVPWAWALGQGLVTGPTAAALWGAVWPVGLAVGAVVLWALLRWRAPEVPEGDVVVLAEWALARGRRLAPRSAVRRPDAPGGRVPGVGAIERAEGALREFPVVGLVLLVLAVVVWAALSVGRA
jgi:formate hydrogenlyase subunit 3/multisubunit Na+/H+ antiporter MnhD subunit